MIRTFTNDEIPTKKFSQIEAREFSGGSSSSGSPRASVSKGLNKFIWDMRYPSVSAIPGVPPVSIKPFAKPGTYQVRLTVDGKSQVHSFELKINPTETYAREETDEKGAFWMEVYAKAEEGVQSVLKAKAAQDKVAAALKAGGSEVTSQKVVAMD